MSKENPRDQADPGKPLPHCKALLICEKVSVSQITGAVSLHNIVERFRLRVFPGRSNRFTIFLQVYDGIGRYSMVVGFNDLADDSTIAEIKFDDLDFPDRLAKIDITIPLDFVQLPRPGRYELVIFVDGQPLARQHFDAEADDGDE